MQARCLRTARLNLTCDAQQQREPALQQVGVLQAAVAPRVVGHHQHHVGRPLLSVCGVCVCVGGGGRTRTGEPAGSG
jgi:hypothetical protein